MNFLAHIYLSQDRDLVQIGNFAADSIKGKKYKSLPVEMQKGILLHRKIDSFTDSHPIVFKSAHRFFEKYGHYNTVLMDVIYDHFLAKNWKSYSNIPLSDYVNSFYELLQTHFEILPKNVQRFYPYMVEQNWLLSYASVNGIEGILAQMNHRIKHRVPLHESIVELEEFYEELEHEFSLFFTELIAYSKKELSLIDQLYDKAPN
ncbi:acyl carrier protein phosphodiesterase [Mesonia algae]|jgi:acyl carrier protein phosphodiesterase|uniref:Acyl carrier protein phosphodiesterase n=1 Tax=Mesonia algae TaxID=213248 RepID=A0A2W7I2R0_9FLAO|nr:acyl carrier protein phosphodiesterase [Mesonia algae]PZW40578.1 acyl carrier protein phosphodiesterase [Mesonia algae]